jgi:hypothetical protein
MIEKIRIQPKIFGVPISVGLTTVFFLIGLARLRGGVFRIPPDPGFDILRQARPIFRFSFFDVSGSYLSIAPRIISKVAAFFPVELSAVIAATSTLIIWAVAATICTLGIHRQTSSIPTSAICGFFCIANPAAGESSIGNYGNAIWQMFVVGTIVYGSAELIRKHNISVSIFSVILGLSHPWSIIMLIPLLGALTNSSSIERRSLIRVICLVAATFIIQVIVFINTGDSAKRTGVTYWWSDMPLFWSFNLMFPPLLMFLVLFLSAFNQQRIAPYRLLPVQIATVGLSVAMVCFIQGGIADRYFVAPMTLAICSIGILFEQSVGRLRVVTRLVFFSTILIVGVGSIKWFTAGPYLNSGPTWNSEIIRLKAECESNQSDKINAQLSIGTADLMCADL